MTRNMEPRHTPTTKRAVLMCGQGRITVHEYVESRFVRLPDAAPNDPSVSVEHMFRCTETGAIRRWGLDSYK